MNANDRKELAKAIKLLEEAQGILESLAEAEEEKFENMSEGLQQSERGQTIETAAEALSGAKESVDEALEKLADVQ